MRKETCAAIARQLDLGPELNLGESEAPHRRRREGSHPRRRRRSGHWRDLLRRRARPGLRVRRAHVRATASATPVALRPDAKTTLQEWAQGQGLEPPTYTDVERTGPEHAPEFTIEVNLAGHEPLRATGPSKKLAEHKAAEAFLIREKVWKETQ